MGTGSNTTTSGGAHEVALNKQKWAFQSDLMTKAGAYADKPYQYYDAGQRFAGFDPSETTAQNRMLGFANQTPGYYGDAMGSVRPNLGFGGAFQRQSLDPVTQAQIQQGVEQRMNPYTSQVIDRTMDDYNRARQMTRDATGAEAMGGGAFGGSRHGVADALTNEAFARQSGNMAAQLRHQGYGQALSGFEGERARLQALRLQQEGMSADDAARAVGLRNQTASLYASLGDLQDRDQLQRIGLQEAVGGKRRAMDQQSRDFAYYQDQQAQQDEIDKIAMMNAVASGNPYTPTPRYTSNKQAGMLGGAASGAALGARTGNPWATAAGTILGAWAGTQ